MRLKWGRNLLGADYSVTGRQEGAKVRKQSFVLTVGVAR